MSRIDEKAAAKEFIKKLETGYYPLERSKNEEVNYCEEKEERDTAAVKAFLQSELFSRFKEVE